MPHTFLQFDFGANEEAAQKAKQAVDRWKQAFRLDKKLLLKFAREDGNKEGKKAAPEDRGIALIIRLDFSDHERLSYQRWLDRIPGEEVFKTAHPKVIRPGDADFAATADKFDELA